MVSDLEMFPAMIVQVSPRLRCGHAALILNAPTHERIHSGAAGQTTQAHLAASHSVYA
jgi:hypothetical protein